MGFELYRQDINRFYGFFSIVGIIAKPVSDGAQPVSDGAQHVSDGACPVLYWG